MSFEIRKTALADLGPALQLDREAFGADAWTFLDYGAVFADRSVKKFTALVDGQFAGFAAMAFDSGQKAACLMTLAVRPEFRNKGIGSALLKKCEEAFSDYNYYLNVDIENKSAIRLYKRAGYHQTGIDPEYYMNKHDAIIMEKHIK